MDARLFLRKYWQKRPLLIRAAFPGTTSFPDKADLFALARDESVESRLVLEQGGERPWQVLHGPFSAARLRRLPATHWSLLVQGVNFHLPRAARLLDEFAFIPNWRMDDLMASYAPDRGSVGAHLDNYDVFLLQTSGRRRWRISSRRYRESDFLPGLDLRMLGNFRHTREWLLEPGDMLYLPPGTAHHGIAVGHSITCSIGLRAPSNTELLAALLDSGTLDEVRMSDPELMLQRDCGEITPGQLTAMRRLVRDTLRGDAELDRRLGRHLTGLPPSVPPPIAQNMTVRAFHGRLLRGRALRRAPCTRAAFTRAAGGGIYLFINGAEFALPAGSRSLAARLSGPGPIHWPRRADAGTRSEIALLHGLYRAGLLQFAD
ncbi:MAG: cupin domain-containing protein [Gammaproteobacteria bacterium]|nr:cupin domain-containing protein [Gammaproteobacteria bacterium]